MGPVDFDALVLAPCVAVFGEVILWQSSAMGAPEPITGIFDEGYKPLTPIDYPDGLIPTNITTGTPHLGVSLSNFPQEPKQGDIIKVRGKTYTIREVQKDSHGGADIFLNMTGKAE